MLSIPIRRIVLPCTIVPFFEAWVTHEQRNIARLYHSQVG